MSQFECVTELEKWFDSYLNFEKQPQKNIFWLDTVNFFCKKLGNPQNLKPCIHIAGSKGKGSVSEMISSILEEAGYKTGLYTSPHILDFVERIGSSHTHFEENVYKQAAKDLQDCVLNTPIDELPGQRPITWFELVTVFAFLCFKYAKTDINVFEVGLGGRLDATNVIKPELCVLMPIELEHTQFLGDTLEKVASEKAGIIKDNIPALSAVQKQEVESVFREKASEHNAKINFINDFISSCTHEYVLDSIKNNTSLEVDLSNLDNNSPRMNIKIESSLFSRKINANLKMLGEYQIQNACIASCAAKMLIPTLDESCIEKGLAKAYLPGRFEVVSNDLVLDGAHTVNSIGFTIKTFNELFGNKKAHLLFACAADKDMDDIALLLKNRFEQITLTKPGIVKQSDLSHLSNAFSKANIKFSMHEDYVFAIKKALEDAKKDNAILLVTGSFYLVSEVKKIIM